MSSNHAHQVHRASRGVIVALLFGAMSGVLTPVVAQDDAPSRKMSRQIGVLEKILDQVLLDSPNFLVPGRNNARGIFLEEFGALLTFEASLVDKDHEFDFEWPGKYRIEENEKGEKVIVIPKWGEDDEEERTPRRRGEARLYDRGKIELREMLLDYGDSMSRLEDGHWIAIAAYLKDSDYFLDERISRLVIRVRMRDLRAYGSGKIDEEEALSRFEEIEY